MQYSSSLFLFFSFRKAICQLFQVCSETLQDYRQARSKGSPTIVGHSHVLCKLMLWEATIFHEITGFLLILTEKIFSNFLRSCFTLFKPTVNLRVALKWTESPLSLQERKGISWILFPVQQKKTLSVIFHFNVKIKYLGHQICKYK